jgi:hypothetical protein
MIVCSGSPEEGRFAWVSGFCRRKVLCRNNFGANLGGRIQGYFWGKCRELGYVDSARLDNRRKLLYASRLRRYWRGVGLTDCGVYMGLRHPARRVD